mgnify:CR=1 FL=1
MVWRHLEASEKLEELNIKRRSIQDEIFDEACQQADNMTDDRVLVVNSGNWNHGVIGIVASKLVEKYKKPVFIIGERGDEATGSARSLVIFPQLTRFVRLTTSLLKVVVTERRRAWRWRPRELTISGDG